MPYLELSLRCTEAEQPRYENALDDVGALSVTLLDADASTPNERALLEPGVGELPLWPHITLLACGHSHVPRAVRLESDLLIVNPGAESPVPLSAVADVQLAVGPAEVRQKLGLTKRAPLAA